jgi:hypothetical protein
LFIIFEPLQEYHVQQVKDNQFLLNFILAFTPCPFSLSASTFHYSLYSELIQPGYLGGIALGYGLDNLGFESQQGLGIFHFTTASSPVLGPTQPPIQWVPGALSLGVKRLVSEAYHSPPSNAEVKNAWSYVFTPTIRLQGVVLS